MTNKWKRAGAWFGGTVSVVALSPRFERDNLILAATLAGIYRSTDGGRRWQLSIAGLDDLTPHAVVFAPPDKAGNLTAFTATQQGRLYHSPDEGVSWEVLESWKFGVVTALAVSPNYAADGTLFVGTGEGVFRSFERGEKWQSASFGLLDVEVLSLACAPDFATSELVWVGTTAGGLYRSRNAGRAWREAGFGLPDSALQCLVVSPAFVEDQTLFVGTETAGLFCSHDAGQSWEAVGSELAGQSLNCLALSPYFHAGAPAALHKQEARLSTGAIWQPEEPSEGSTPSPGYNQTLLAGTTAGVFLSVDGGRRWLPAQNGPAAPLAIAMAGGGYAIAGSYQEGLAISEDEGRRWQLSIEGLAAHVPPLVARLSASPGIVAEQLVAAAIDSGLVRSQDGGTTWQTWPVTADNVPAQALAVDGDECFVAITDKLYHLTPAGGTWVELDPPLEAGARLDLLAFSSRPDQNHKILVGLQTGQLYLSEDTGGHWQMIPSPPAGETVLLQAAFSSVSTLNLVTASQPDSSGFKIQLWRSVDKGHTWQELMAVSPARRPAAVLLMPQIGQDYPLFLAIQNQIIKLVQEPAGQQLGISQSSLAEGLHITTLITSPTYETDRTLFAAANKGVFYSGDDGATWQLLGQGLEGRAVVALFKPEQQARIGAVTLGGEVWRLE